MLGVYLRNSCCTGRGGLQLVREQKGWDGMGWDEAEQLNSSAAQQRDVNECALRVFCQGTDCSWCYHFKRSGAQPRSLASTWSRRVEALQEALQVLLLLSHRDALLLPSCSHLLLGCAGSLARFSS